MCLQRFVVKTFVMQRPKITWCPAADCLLAVDGSNSQRVKQSKAADGAIQQCLLVSCANGHAFCFWCGELGDYGQNPVSCKNMKDWAKRSQDEGGGATIAWIESNTKQCPNCGNAVINMF